MVTELERRTGRRWRYRQGDVVAETLATDLRDFGPFAVLAAIKAIDEPHPDFPQLVFGASRALHPITAGSPPPEPDPEYVRAQLRAQRNGDGHAQPR